MSRSSPFPTNPGRARSPPLSYSESSATKPLSVNRDRPPSRSNDPDASAFSPSRPARSDRRQPSSSSSSSRTTDRMRGDEQLPRIRTKSNLAPHDEVEPLSATSPTAMPAVIAAFQSAGRTAGRKRTGTLDQDSERDNERGRELEQEKQRQKRMRDKQVNRRQPGRVRPGDIDAVLDQIQDEWEPLINPEFNPVDLALQLLDESSVGKDFNAFRRSKAMLSKQLKGSVDKHYQAFAAALPHHAALLNHLGNVQSQINDSRTSLQEAKDVLGNRRADLVQLWNRGQVVEEMMRILDQIERLKAVPDILESLISEKRLLQAAILLVRSLKTINNSDLAEVGAVADLRSYLIGQETALREILVDELQSHIFLKSFWCESRWSAYTPGQQSFLRLEFEDEPPLFDSDRDRQLSPNERPSRMSRYLTELTMRPNDSPFDLSDPDLNASSGGRFNASLSGSSLSNTGRPSFPGNFKNPESDSFSYIEMLLESLAVLGKLASALDIVSQRLPSEVHALVEVTLDEVSERVDFNRRTQSSAPTLTSEKPSVYLDTNSSLVSGTSPLRLAALESYAKHGEQNILLDFFWTLYSKLDAVLQGLRILYEVSNRITSRRDFKDSSGSKVGTLFPLGEAWTPVEGEVRSLLQDYLTNEEQGSISGRNPISSISEVLRNEGRLLRDNSKPVFRFADTDSKSTVKTLKRHEDELNRVLKDTMPGLVQGSLEAAAQNTLMTVGTDDRMVGIGQHRVLIRPDAFHVSALFKPTLAFLDRIVDVLPSGIDSARSFSIFLNEFILKVYIPQLEDKVSTLLQQAISGSEAFQIDQNWIRLSPMPLLKTSTLLMALINSLCVMHATTPFHRDNYARLVLGVIIQFYQRCSDRFYELVSFQRHDTPDGSQIALAARWAQRPDFNDCLSRIFVEQTAEPSDIHRLYKEETQLELDALEGSLVDKKNLILNARNVSALCTLYHSIMWFTAQLSHLKALPLDDSQAPLSPRTEPPVTATTPFTPMLPVLPPTPAVGESVQLQLSREMALRFEALVKTYEQLAALIAYTVRVDIRCRVISYLEITMRHGNYLIQQEAGEPDSHIVDLNAELSALDVAVSSTVSNREHSFIFGGLSQLIQHVLIVNTRHVRLANGFGVKKIVRNMLALQQNVKTIAGSYEDTGFEHGKRYFALFDMSPERMIQSIRRKQEYSFDEYEAMLDLQCGVDRTLGEAAAAQATDRNYSRYMIDLHGLELESSPDEK